jgi:hypothetical protein
MSERSNTHYHLTHKQGRSGPVMRQSEAIVGADAAMRLLEEIAARFIRQGCRVVKYDKGIRVYDCKNAPASDQSFEVHECERVECGLTPSEGEYGRWAKADRQKYLLVLSGRGLTP